MKLHPVDRQGFVPEPHDLLLCRFRSYFEAVREGLTLYEERVVSGRFERIRKIAENTLSVMNDRGCLPVHQPSRAHDVAAEHLSHALMPEADAENWRFFRKCPNHIAADSRFIRSAGTGRDDDPFGLHRSNLFDGNLIIPLNEQFSPKLTKVLDEVVGEAVVII